MATVGLTGWEIVANEVFFGDLESGYSLLSPRMQPDPDIPSHPFLHEPELLNELQSTQPKLALGLICD